MQQKQTLLVPKASQLTYSLHIISQPGILPLLRHSRPVDGGRLPIRHRSVPSQARYGMSSQKRSWSAVTSTPAKTLSYGEEEQPSRASGSVNSPRACKNLWIPSASFQGIKARKQAVRLDKGARTIIESFMLSVWLPPQIVNTTELSTVVPKIQGHANGVKCSVNH